MDAPHEQHIFGLENFGNTCYCNSILQCLYYTLPFRNQILQLAKVERPPRLAMAGIKPHAITLDLSNRPKEPADPVASSKDSSSSSGFVRGLFGRKDRDESGVPIPGRRATRTSSIAASIAGSVASAGANSASAASTSGIMLPLPPPEPISQPNRSQNSIASQAVDAGVIGQDFLKAHPGLEDIDLGPHAVGQNVPIVGICDDMLATNERRKRAALVQGPIINLDHTLCGDYNMEESLLTALKDLFECIAENESRTGVASPVNFIETLKRENELFRSSMHQDAHEFFNVLLNTIIEQMDKLGAGTNWAHDLFEGMITSETRCMVCESVTQREEKCLDFSIDLERNTSVYHCLNQFSASETLSGANKFHCDQCGSLQEAQKRMKVKRAPQILVLHLKRFKFSESEQKLVKLLHRVMYSRYIRLPVTSDDCLTPEKLYELTSVVVHLGRGPHMGHYVSVVNTPNGWLLFDDEVVEAVDANYPFRFFGDGTRMATAYVLFFQETTQEKVGQDALKISTEISANDYESLFNADFHSEDEITGSSTENLSPLAPPLRRTSVATSATGSPPEWMVGTPEVGRRNTMSQRARDLFRKQSVS